MTIKPFKEWKKQQGKIKCHICNGSGWEGDVFVVKCLNCNATGMATPTIEQYKEQVGVEKALLKKWRQSND